MRNLGFYLLYAGVVARSYSVYRQQAVLGQVMALLGIYGLLLLAEGWISRREGTVLPVQNSAGTVAAAQKPLLQRGLLPVSYILAQFMIASWLVRVQPDEDFFASLFLPISLQAVLFFGWRAGLAWIAVFTLSLSLPLLGTGEGIIFGGVMAGLYGGLSFLLGGYAYQIQQVEAKSQANQRMLAELQRAHGQLEQYAAQMKELAIEGERARLARDLHDSVTQTMFSMNLAVQSARLLFPKDPQQVPAHLDRLDQLAASAQQEIQTIAAHLRFKPAVEGSLPDALRKLAAERKQRDGLEVSIEALGDCQLPEATVLALYQIAQEALNNVAKHAGTRQVAIHVDLNGVDDCLEIADRGRGFDPQIALAQRGHLGLAGIAERAEAAGWRLSIDSQPGKGTRIRVSHHRLEETQ